MYQLRLSSAVKGRAKETKPAVTIHCRCVSFVQLSPALAKFGQRYTLVAPNQMILGFVLLVEQKVELV